MRHESLGSSCSLRSFARVGSSPSLMGQVRLGSSPTALDAWHRMRDHLAANEVDLAATPITLGRELRLNADATEVRGDPVATAMLRREDRPPFTF